MVAEPDAAQQLGGHLAGARDGILGRDRLRRVALGSVSSKRIHEAARNECQDEQGRRETGPWSSRPATHDERLAAAVNNGPMPNRRSHIAMSGPEVTDFLKTSKTAVLTSLGDDGWPHSVAMWFVVVDSGGDLGMWTYRKSQKVKNVERDPRVAFLTETGEAYNELRGVLVRGEVEVVHDFEKVRSIGRALNDRYVVPSAPEAGSDPQILAEIDRQAHKRVGLLLSLEKVASWDHRKLAGLHKYS